ncbi:Protein boule-like [Holothuria leucospilota]|uniref:Protein boule-like n=1 Tax=Holothuria leucospilota TaxID=206669 RepID=A0A9Q0YN04_HOLLE|nr:Protein boule-like [Holothuria leucospilota]
MTDIQNQTPTTESSRAGSTAPSSPVPSGHNAPRYGTVIPNRIFVGGIAFNTNDIELKNFFSAFGHVKEVKIISDRAGVSKGYGFITFETQEEALRILKEQPNSLVFKDKKLNIGQAIRKQPTRYPKEHEPTYLSNGMILQSPAGTYSYTYHNGVAYFNPGDPLQLVPGPAGHATAAAVAHHPHATQNAYAPLTVPVMLPPTTVPQFVSTQPQASQLAYPPTISTNPQWPAPHSQVRFIHPAQAAAVQNAGLLYPTAAGSEVIYTAATHPQTHQPSGHHFHHPSEVSAEVPVMETSHPETAAVPSEHQVPQAVIARPSTCYPDITYATAIQDPSAYHTFIPKATTKFSGKRPIKMPRRDRAAKTIRTTADGTSVSGAVISTGTLYDDGSVLAAGSIYKE